MVTALFRYERIRTTLAKARAVSRTAERLITRARADSVHNRRQAARRIGDKEVLAKLFTDIAVRFRERPGGYTRVVKLGQRYGDASEMVLLELVDGAVHNEAAGTPRRRRVLAAQVRPSAPAGGPVPGTAQVRPSAPAGGPVPGAAQVRPSAPAGGPVPGAAQVRPSAPAGGPVPGAALSEDASP